MRYVWKRRLEHCAKDMREPHHESDPIPTSHFDGGLETPRISAALSNNTLAARHGSSASGGVSPDPLPENLKSGPIN